MGVEDDYRIYLHRDPDFWGPKFWDVLYLSALGLPLRLPEETKRIHEHFYKNLHAFLPCIHCRYHYFRNPRRSSIRFETRMDVLDFLNNIQNDVARQQGKGVVTIDQTIDRLHWNYLKNRYGYVPFLAVAIMLAFLLFKLIHPSKIRR